MERFYDHQPHQPPLLRLQVHNVAKLFRKTPVMVLERLLDFRYVHNGAKYFEEQIFFILRIAGATFFYDSCDIKKTIILTHIIVAN